VTPSLPAEPDPVNLPTPEDLVGTVDHDDPGEVTASYGVNSGPEKVGQLEKAKDVIRKAVVAAELLPVTNEGSRYAAFAAANVLTHSNPLAGAVVLGGGTLIVEGAGAIAASSLITRPNGVKFLKWLNNKLQNFLPEDKGLSKPIVDAGIAMTFGTPALMTVEQGRKPERTSIEAKRQGLLTATWLAGVFAVEGALTSMGVQAVNSIPAKVSAGVLITGALMAMPSWIKKIASARSAELADRYGTVSEIVQGDSITQEQTERSLDNYESFHGQEDEAVKVGLYGEDLEKAFKNPEAVLIGYEPKRKGEETYAPLLVPAKELEWYNTKLLTETYGEGAEVYYYAHPPIPSSEESQALVADAIRQKLDNGSIVFTDQYISQPDGILESIASKHPELYLLENLGNGEKHRTGEVFVAPITFNGVTEVKEGPPLREIYRQLVEDGELSVDENNGVALIDVIEGEDAEKIWEIYNNPFAKLTEGHPMYAGFTKEDLIGILADPEVAKIVNRVNGSITTLCFFVQDFDHCPWFNKQYYKDNYPEYYDTNNIAIFPGIVSDENAKGSAYSLPVIDLTTRLYAGRGTNGLITFECTETSAEYIPKLVTFAINHGSHGRIQPIGEPVSITEYKALHLAS
jgi:hypothetical protein